ncbi:MAG: SRPBCC family protein [Paraglaciecola sp.]|uniref:SRPBCC family protein n=1 Tax=Paraglaciecola sp. TaxID=1920173 RepID=UPI00273FB9D9|nr:SRPBCC family protein [Paraglaciecola sp.]MDP5029925.1 SRPBCC family protein [Paraglaciecola sp.]MDP5130745.1 SRPBCC family protein [Paraglaciecola sp.]
MKISIEMDINASLAQIWSAWTTPTHITQWNFASDDWCCPRAQIDLQVGQTFNYRMEAKDGSMGFDFEGEFTEIKIQQGIVFKLEDGREVSIEFRPTAHGVKVVETFEAESANTAELQRQGWLNILSNFKKHVESLSN